MAHFEQQMSQFVISNCREKNMDIDAFEKSTELKLGEVLGKGAYGQVFKAKHHQTEKCIAVKFSRKFESLHHEYKMYEELKLGDFSASSWVQRIPMIYGFGQLGEITWFGMELLGPTIRELFQRLGKFSKETIVMMGVQMINCLQYLHQRKIVHGDIKGENFALSCDDPRKIMIFDFGLANKLPNSFNEFRGSLLYAPIKSHQFEPIGPKDDFESLAYLLADYHTGLPWGDEKKWPMTDIFEQIEFGLKQKLKKKQLRHVSEFL